MVLITGANGFLGQNLCTEMLRQGWRVKAATRSVDPLIAGAKPVMVGSIDGETNWADALSGVDAVVHLAARVHVMRDEAADLLAEFRAVNVEGTLNLARQAAKAGVRRFIYLSSIKVNGEETASERPFTEEDQPAPQDAYAVSKWEAELALHNISDATGLEVVILRPPLVYGQGVKANFLRLLDMVNKNIPLPLSMINNKRSMIYIGNLVDAIIKCIEHPDAANQTFLVSDGQDISTPELIKMIAEAMGKKARLFPCPVSLLKMMGKVSGKSAEIERLTGSLQVDSSKIRMTLNSTPPHTIEEGIIETVKIH